MGQKRIRIPLLAALRMIWDYSSIRVKEQLRSVAFIVIYLVAFQIIVFGSPPQQALSIAFGIALVVLGLAFFTEGLVLGLMPLGERVGIQLPAHGGLVLIIPFGILLGIASTFAEPAVAALRAAGAGIDPELAPLLFYMLEQNPQLLVLAIGIGVGIAVALGMMRFYIGFSIKPVIAVIFPILLAATYFFSRNDILAPVLNLAWDAGAVTTGAVTVPLVLALGVGVSRSSGKGDRAGSSFGIVMLASALPVLTVMILGLILYPGIRDAGSQGQPPAVVMEAEHAPLSEHDSDHDAASIMRIIRGEISPAMQAIVPLTALLSLVLFLLLRDKPRYMDEVLLGIFFALIGMTLLTSGVKIGLSPLGDEAGRLLPQIYQQDSQSNNTIVIENFDLDHVFTAYNEEGNPEKFFYFHDGKRIRSYSFEPQAFNPELSLYRHNISSGFLLHPRLSRAGIIIILLFAFGMGYGSTLAEPALNALGKTAEELSIGTVKKTAVIRAVSIGVGAGLVLGVFRILYDLPSLWFLIIPYSLALLLTFFSDEYFVGIAWDSGGVTTGTITVPLVMAMGLGIGRILNVADGFGILALASVFPILSVLLYGISVKIHQKTIARAIEGEDSHV